MKRSIVFLQIATILVSVASIVNVCSYIYLLTVSENAGFVAGLICSVCSIICVCASTAALIRTIQRKKTSSIAT